MANLPSILEVAENLLSMGFSMNIGVRGHRGQVPPLFKDSSKVPLST